MELINSQTYVNLAKAYSGETQARTRYEFVEYGMRNEGYATMAEIIDTIAYQEFNHARMYYTYLQKASAKPIKNIEYSAGFPFKEKWTILDNLKFAAEDEHNEAKIYLAFAKTAKKEGFDDIAKLFEQTAAVEKIHESIFLELYEQMKEGTLYKRDDPTTWVCSSCGYAETSTEGWTECPLCKAKQGAILLHLKSMETSDISSLLSLKNSRSATARA